MTNKYQKAVFASGCFWGTQYYMDSAEGVIESIVGYTGGTIANPTYEQVSRGDTGHVEAVEVTYDPRKSNYETLAKLFFQTHDATQTNGQGPDIGSQYRSVIYYSNDDELQTAKKLIEILRRKGMTIATRVCKLGPFYPAEGYHQDYHVKSGGTPYCHVFRKLF
jgi:methionine-S-sulfoxide reductase